MKTVKTTEVQNINNIKKIKEGFDSGSQAREYFKNLGYKTLTKFRAKIMKPDDFLEMVIYDETPNKNRVLFHLVSYVDAHQDSFWLHDIKSMINPDDYNPNGDASGDVWKIELENLGTKSSHLFFYKKIGTKLDYPEYFL